MPGTKTRAAALHALPVQFCSATRQSFVDSDSSSRWLRVGDGRAAATQSGFNFRFDDPPEGEQFVLQGGGAVPLHGAAQAQGQAGAG